MTTELPLIIAQAAAIGVFFYFGTRFMPNLESTVSIRTFIAIWLAFFAIVGIFKLGTVIPIEEWSRAIPRFLALDTGLVAGSVLGWRARES